MALACAPACALESKSLGEDESAGSEDDDGDDDDGSEEVGTGDDVDETPPQGVELRAGNLEGVTPTEIAIAPDGAIYVVGKSGYAWDAEVEQGEYGSAWIGKLETDGTDFAWSIEPGVPPGAVSVAATTGGFVVAANSTVDRYSANGNVLWSSDVPVDVGVARVAIGPDGTIVVAGMHVLGADSFAAWTAAYDDAGALLWQSAVGTGDVESSSTEAIAFAPNGDVIVGGLQGVAELTGRGRAWIAAVSPTGETRWVQTYTEGMDSDSVDDLHVTSDGTIHAVVIEDDVSSIRRFDADGVETWVWDPALTSEVRSIAVASDGSFIATDGRVPEQYDPPVALRVASHDRDGTVRWFDERADCTLGADVAILASGEVLVAGACPPGQGDVEIAMGLFVYAP